MQDAAALQDSTRALSDSVAAVRDSAAAMPDFLMVDWSQMWPLLVKLVIAFLLALPIAWEREERTRLMGLRTFPIVAIASCAYVLIAQRVLEGNEPGQARIIQGLITGMGFIGGGAILKGKGGVQGTATAASLWGTGAVGMAVAYDDLVVAATISLVIFLTLQVLTPIQRRVGKDNAFQPGTGEEDKEEETKRMEDDEQV